MASNSILPQLASAPDNIPVIFLMGPTATGKTDAAAYLTHYLPVEIVSVDSSLVYRGMDIGTAKPDPAFLQSYPHHLVDIRNPDETYSAADFVADSTRLIKEITARGNIPLLVGGTSFYFSALERGLPDLPPACPDVRNRINEQAETQGWAALHAHLQDIDPKSAARIDINDPQRIQRALEINELTGKPVGLYTDSKCPIPNPICKITMSFSDRAVLHKRVQQRFDIMLEAGLVAEVKTLIDDKYDRNLPAFRMIGYRQTIEFLEEKINLDKMVESGVIATRQLAKRQLTWLRNQSNVMWWVSDQELIDKRFQSLLAYIQQLVITLYR